MTEITLIATMKHGLEKVVKTELKRLGFETGHVAPGRVEFQAYPEDIPTANLWLRSADRVRIKIAEFETTTFDDLFEKTKALPWGDWITQDGKFTVTGRSVKSTLFSVRSCQAIVKKATVEAMKSHYNVEWFDEDGPSYTIEVAIHKDMALLTIDTSGAGLHKRGYRAEAGEAPLKETLAAALVQLSFWRPDRRLIDPMCGSGTILIEAAMIACNMAPGLNRSFASERWPIVGDEAWKQAREGAQAAIKPFKDADIFGYDIDPYVIAIAKSNAEKAGVAKHIQFGVKEVKDLWIDREHGIVITNPPYGMRISEFQEMNQIYIALHKTFRKKEGWSVYVYTADEKFPDFFKRARPDRVRKLFNGTIRADYYQFYGKQPGR